MQENTPIVMVPEKPKKKFSARAAYFALIIGLLLMIYGIAIAVTPMIVRAYYQNLYDAKAKAIENIKNEIMAKDKELHRETKDLCQVWLALRSTKNIQKEERQSDFDPCLAYAGLENITF